MLEKILKKQTKEAKSLKEFIKDIPDVKGYVLLIERERGCFAEATEGGFNTIHMLGHLERVKLDLYTHMKGIK